LEKLQRKLAHSTYVEWAVHSLTFLSALSLGILLVVTFASVIMRYFLNAPILGSNEIIQLASVALVMLAMPGAAQAGMHIRVDVFDERIGAVGRFVGDVLTRAVSVYLLGILAWRAWGKLLDAAEFGDVTNMLRIPFWPFYGLLILGSVVYALVLAIQLVDIIRSGAASDE
jgi:TRAP-type C4-dicarboxylate transport system permease small subunit